MNGSEPQPSSSPNPPARSSFSHYLPRLRREFYQADAVVFWTLPVAHRARGWLSEFCPRAKWRSRRRQSAHSAAVRESAPTAVGGYAFRRPVSDDHKLVAANGSSR
ncbi:MAG: hypothetical protein WCK27_15425 [Verrucomicrobiota bacterium]